MLQEVGNINSVRATFKWEIHDFCMKCKLPLERLISPRFSAHNCNWRLELFPKGIKDSDEGFTSLYLKLLDIDKEVSIKYSIAILNNNNEKYLSNESTFHKLFKDRPTCGWAKFIRTDELVDKNNHLLTGDKLKIICEIVVDDTTYSYKQVNESNLKQAKRYQRLEKLHNFENFFNNSKFSDVKFVIKEKSLYAHKNILANQSGVFAAMFEHDMKENRENEVLINDVDHDVFYEVLRFVYTSEVNNMDKLVTDLLHAAEKYGLTGLKDLCAAHLVNNITVNNVLELLILADRYDLKALKIKSIYFIAFNTETIVGAIIA